MKFPVSLARLSTPSRAKVEKFLRSLEEALEKQDTTCFDLLQRKLPAMATAHGFFVEAVTLISPVLRSQNTAMVLAALNTIDTIVGKYGNKLSTFSMARLLSDLLLCERSCQPTSTMAKNCIFKIIRANATYALHALDRLVTVSNEDLKLEVISLLYQYIMNTRDLDPVVVSKGCSIGLEGLLSPSLAARLEAFDLVCELYHRSTPTEPFVKVFAKTKTPEELLKVVRTQLQRGYRLPRMITTSELTSSSDDGSEACGQPEDWCFENLLADSDYDCEACLIAPCLATAEYDERLSRCTATPRNLGLTQDWEELGNL